MIAKFISDYINKQSDSFIISYSSWYLQISFIFLSLHKMLKAKMLQSIIQMTLLGLCFFGTIAIASTTPSSNAQAYDMKASLIYANLSKIAYCPAKCITSWTCQPGLKINLTDTMSIQNPQTQTRGYAGYYLKNNLIVVVFKGTSSDEERITDIKHWKVPYEDVNCQGCKVHNGFLNAYSLIKKQTEDVVRKLLQKYPEANIVITGHSLGGALAVLASLHLKKEFEKKIIQLHTFGQPRVGESDFAAFVNKRIDKSFRIVHNRDPVPHALIKAGVFNNYHHSATEVFFENYFSSYKVCNDSGEDQSCSNRFRFPHQLKLSDHSHYFIIFKQTKC